MKLVVGLGNVGKKYESTYHNVGFSVVDVLAEKYDTKFSKTQCKALTAEARVNGEKIIFAKPNTFMNLSGQSVVSLKNKYKIPYENILIVYDDIDLELGKIRYRMTGSAGTHNGMRSVVLLTGTKDIKRIKVGIGRDERIDLADYVLSKISVENKIFIDKSIKESVDKIIKEFLS